MLAYLQSQVPKTAPKAMLLPMGFAKRVVFGGPYLDRPFGYVGVKLAPEVVADAMIELPIHDFSVPRNTARAHEVVWLVLNRLAEKDAVYVGCMGGKGRTGLFLALLAKVMDVPYPIEYVRYHYYARAIENKMQERYIEDYESPFTRWDLTWLKVRAFRAGLKPTGLGLPPS